jgi:LPXTG-site transpeptidase (sortase) family protein
MYVQQRLMPLLPYEPFPSPGIPKNLLLAAVPLILLFSSLGGSVAFVGGSGIGKALESHPRRATLPVAGDRLITFADHGRPSLLSVLQPLVTLGSSPTQRLAPIPTGAPGNLVRIPSLGVAVPLALAKSMNDTDVLTALSEGVALYPNGITPGQPGNAFISGHSTGEPWKGVYRFAFIHINNLKPGDAVLVDYDGTRYTYRVTGSRTIDPRVVPTLDPSGSKPTVTLMTCWPLWTTKHRVLQDAELIAVNPLVVRKF